MKKFIDTIKNIWSIEELRNRIQNTLMFLLIYRLGSFIVLPGVNSAALANGGESNGLAQLINQFAGGAFNRASIFALGIMPYISASIIMQLLSVVLPSLQRLQKEGESGRAQINRFTRILTIIITLVQAPAYLATQVASKEGAVISADTMSFIVPNTIILVACTMFIMWLGEKITDKGIGNGISLLITVGIIVNLPTALVQEFGDKIDGNNGGWVMMVVEMVGWFLVTLVTILLIQGVRKVPLQYAKQIAGGVGYQGVTYANARQHLPLKVNIAGVMPIIFAQAIMLLPNMILQVLTSGDNQEQASTSMVVNFLQSYTDFTSPTYNITLALMIIVFTYFYTAMVINPNQHAEDLKKQGAFIPGVKPGKDTADYIDGILSKITLPGAVFLAGIAILPAIISLVGVKQQFAYFFGGTSLLIMVGVVLDTLQQIESYLLMKKYDGLMSSGKITGRSSAEQPTNVI